MKKPLKKFLSLLLSLIMLTGITAGLDLSAYAAISGDFEYDVLDDGTVDSDYYNGTDALAYDVSVTVEGTVVTVTVTLPGELNAAGGNFTLEYNSEKLVFSKTVEKASIIEVNPYYNENSVRGSWSQASAITQDTALCVMEFEYIGGTLTAEDFAITDYKIYDENSNLISENTTTSVVIDFIDASASALAYTVSVTVEGTVVTVTVTLPGELNAAAGNFTLEYNSEKLVFSKTVSTATSSSLVVTVNPNYSENSVRASWSQASAITQDTALWVMEFEYIGGTLTAEDFAITDYKIYDGNLNLISENTTTSVVIDFIDASASALAYDVSVTVEGTVVTVTVTLPGELNAAAGNFTLQYDNEKVVFSKTVSTATSLAITVNPNYSENSVRASWAQETAITQDTVLWVMEFEYIGGTLTAEDFAVTDYKIYDGNLNLISENTTTSVVIDFIDASASALAYTVSVTVEGTVVTVTVTLPGELNAAGGNFTLEYDNEKVVFSKTVSTANLQITVNETYTEDSVRAAWAQATAITQDTALWVMEFEYIGGTLSAEDFAVTAFRIYDENAQLISGDTTASAVINFTCNHAKAEELETKEATCTESGYYVYACACGETITQTIAATGHAYGEWSVSVEPTCTEKGEEIRTCSKCAANETQEIEALGHEFSDEWTVDEEATCVSDGLKSHHCTRCDSRADVTVIEATGHSYGEWQTRKEATCTEDGIDYRVCSLCGDEETLVTSSLGHNYGPWTVTKEATVSYEGTEERTCTRCSDVEVRSIDKLQIDNPVTGVFIDKTELILLTGDTAQLTATVSPQDATVISVQWYSDDPSIATVDENGVVTAVSSGTTQIYVVTEDGGYYAVCEVTVESAVIFGDITGDGIIDAADVVMVQRYDAGLITLNAEQLEAADVTGDGIVDAADVVMIQRYDAGLIASL